MRTVKDWSLRCPHCGHEIKMEIVTVTGGGSGPPDVPREGSPSDWSPIFPQGGAGSVPLKKD